MSSKFISQDKKKKYFATIWKISDIFSNKLNKIQRNKYFNKLPSFFSSMLNWSTLLFLNMQLLANMPIIFSSKWSRHSSLQKVLHILLNSLQLRNLNNKRRTEHDKGGSDITHNLNRSCHRRRMGSFPNATSCRAFSPSMNTNEKQASS